MYRFEQTVDASAGGPSYSKAWVPDVKNSEFAISIGVEVITSALYTVQHIFANPFEVDLNAVSAGAWYNHEFLVDKTTTDDGNYAFPVTGIRLKVSAANTGSAKITIIQAA